LSSYIKAGVIGVLGYAGEELVEILLGHPFVEILYIEDKVENFREKTLEKFPELNSKKLSSSPEILDVVFLALPHSVSLEYVPKFINLGKKVIDLSADYRLKNKDTYEKWYGVKHTSAELLEKSIYGLPEVYREKISSAQLIANPGCYPTSIILGALPATKNLPVDKNLIIADSKSGISGGGKKFVEEYLSKNVDNTYAYQVTKHRHTPEIEQELSTNVIFTPHVVPQERGILSTIYMKLNKEIALDEVISTYKNFYKDEPFIRILTEGKLPQTANVVNTNFCEIGFAVDKKNKFLIVISAIDNLVKGASGQAVQNMNIMFNLDEKSGLIYTQGLTY